MAGDVSALFAYLFYMPQWNIGTAEGTLDDVLNNGKLPPIYWWPSASRAVFCADPVFYSSEIVFERMNRWWGKAELWVANSDGSRQRRFVRQPYHISYPHIATFEGRDFLVYESSAAKRCEILEHRQEGWIVISRLDQPVVDGTLLHFNSRWWLFGTLANGTESTELHIWWADGVEGPWIAHQANPVKRGASSSRPAGGFCWTRSGLIRPAQDCTQTYGGGVTLCRVDRLDEHTYQETVLLRLSPDAEFPMGIHTINTHNNLIVVDGKRQIFHPFAALLRWNCSPPEPNGVCGTPRGSSLSERVG